MPEKTAQAKTMLTDLERQQQYTEALKQRGQAGFTLIATEAFVQGMRDSGYKSTATAIDEFIDNSIQAQAFRIDVICETQRGQIDAIAVIDDGHGMEPDMMRAAVTWGGTPRHNDRSGFGRYGFGLPSAAVSITKTYDVYSAVQGGKWHRIRIDLDEIASGRLTDAHGTVRSPSPSPAELPDFVRNYLKSQAESLTHGTVIVLNTPDRLTSGFRRPSSFERKMLEHLGLIYRGCLRDTEIYLNGKRVNGVDPLFLDPNGRFYDVKNGVLAEAQEPLDFEFKTADGIPGTIRMRFSYMSYGFQVGPTSRNNERFNIMKENNAYLIVTRAGRQIDLVTKTGYQKPSSNRTIINYDRNWAIELDFDPALDEEFGITVNKQQVTLSQRVWDKLEEMGIPVIAKGLRNRYEREERKGKADTQRGEAKPSESIMSEAEKFEGARSRKTSSEKQTEARDKVRRDAQTQSEETGEDVESVFGAILTAIESKPYKVEFEHLPGAPFFRAEQYGPQLRLFINTEHRFYSDLYDAPNASGRVKTALELLLFVLSKCEVDSASEREDFYQQERQAWSQRLESRLRLLDQLNPIEEVRVATESVDGIELVNVAAD